MNKTERKKDILFIIPFLLIIIFGILIGYFSFIESSKKAKDLNTEEINELTALGLDRLKYIREIESTH